MQLSRSDLERIKDKARNAERYRQRTISQSPSRSDVIREFGAGAIRDHPDGSWSATIKHDRQKILRAERMMHGIRKAQSEYGEEVKSRIQRERVRTSDGRVLDLYAHLADNTARKGRMRPMGKNHGPRDYFSLGESAARYIQGPDGLYFLWDDGWAPCNLWRKDGIGREQRDPDGNIWVEAGEGWVLKEELNGADANDRNADPGSCQTACARPILQPRRHRR